MVTIKKVHLKLIGFSVKTSMKTNCSFVTMIVSNVQCYPCTCKISQEKFCIAA